MSVDLSPLSRRERRERDARIQLTTAQQARISRAGDAIRAEFNRMRMERDESARLARGMATR